MNIDFMGQNNNPNTTKPLAENKPFKKKVGVILTCFILILIVISIIKPNNYIHKLFANLGRIISNSSLLGNAFSNTPVENLGVQFQSMASEGSSMFFDTNNDPHWLGIYNKIIDGSGKTQFFDVNLNTGATRYFNTNKVGRGNGTGKALSGNKLYIGVNDPCYIWEYDISTGGFAQKSISGWADGVCGSVSSDKVIQSAYTANDGVVYMGTATRGTIIEINPSTGAMRDFGVIDPPSGDPNCSTCTSSRYVASIAADSNYIYAGMRYTGNNYWWLAIINRTDGSLSDSCWKNSGLNSGGVSASTDGTQIWYTTNSGDYRLDTTNGQCPSTTGTAPSLKRWFYASNVYFPDNDSYAKAASVFGVDIDVSELPVDSSTSGLSTMRYRNPAGSGSYTTKTQSIQMMDTLIRRLKSNSDGTGVYVIAGSYGPNALFNGSSTSILGRITNQSTYAVTPVGSYVYISGYTATTYRWTPSLPWTLNSSNGTSCNSGSPTNPCLALQALGKYHYYGTVANDGFLYLGVDYARGDRSGGDIAWINPTNNATGSLAFTCDSPKGLTLLSNGTTIAYSSAAENGSFNCTNTEGKVFLFDTNTHTVQKTLAPITGSSSQGKIIGTKDGGILGIIKDYPSTGNYTLYKVNTNGSHDSWSPMVVSGNIFGSSATADQNLLISNDNMVYAWDSSGIIRIDPTDGSRVLYSSVSGVNYIEFAGQDLYIATGTTLKRVQGVNPPPTQQDPVNQDPDPINQNNPSTNTQNQNSSDKSIVSFNFNYFSPAITGTIDETNHTISVTVPAGTDITYLVPQISYNGASITPSGGVYQNFTNPVVYTVKAQDSSTQQYTVTVKVAPRKSSDRAITSFNFKSLSPVVTGSIDTVNYIISLAVPFGTNISGLIPSILTNGISINPANEVPQDFTKPVTYSVTAEDGSIQQYTVNVKIVGKATEKENTNQNENTKDTTNKTTKKTIIKKITTKTILTKNLKTGNSGEEVKQLQIFLNKNGFNITTKGPGSTGKETTFFGSLTKKALIKFQKENKLKPDGIVGPATRSKINELNK